MAQTALNEQERQRLLEKYVLERAQTAENRSAIARRSPGTIAPLTFTQEELWRHETQSPEIAPLYNECVTVRMRGPLDRVALEKSLNEIVRRHEIWRTTFETRAGQPVQIVHPATPLRLRSIDANDLPVSRDGRSGGEGIAQCHAVVGEDVSRKFALQSEPPLRATLVRAGESEHWLFVAAHLMVLDGVSAYQIFPLELAALYRAYAEGKSSPLVELPVQYGDFALWQREAGRANFAGQIKFWRKQLAEQPQTTDWPNSKPGLQQRHYRGMIRPFAFSPELSAKLREFARRENSSLFLVLLAAFAVLVQHEKVQRRTGQEKVTLGTPVSSGRNQNEVLNLLGYFLNAVTLGLNFEDDPTFHELVAQTRIVLSEAMLNADVPIEELAREIRGEQNPSPSPFFRSAVGMQPSTPSLDLDWDVTTMDVESGGSPWEFYLAFIDRPQAVPQPITGRVQFDSESISAQEAMSTIADLQVLLEALIGNPLRRVSEIGLS